MLTAIKTYDMIKKNHNNCIATYLLLSIVNTLKVSHLKNPIFCKEEKYIAMTLVCKKFNVY